MQLGLNIQEICMLPKIFIYDLRIILRIIFHYFPLQH